MATIRVRNVTKSFPIQEERLQVLDGIEFEVPSGQVIAIIGPNGSGKSTLLRIIGGLIAPDTGSIEVDDQPIAGPDERIGLVFQEPRLLPWRTVQDNVALPLELAGLDRANRRDRARELLDLVGIRRFEGALPGQLSGGMRQRAAIARALVADPGLLLLDEPFSALDALTRERFNAELLQLWAQTQTTILLVTHSIPEAVFLADRVFVLSGRPGRLLADVPVEWPRPRSLSDSDEAAFSHVAARIRAHLVDPDESEEPQAVASGAPR